MVIGRYGLHTRQCAHTFPSVVVWEGLEAVSTPSTQVLVARLLRETVYLGQGWGAVDKMSARTCSVNVGRALKNEGRRVEPQVNHLRAPRPKAGTRGTAK